MVIRFNLLGLQSYQPHHHFPRCWVLNRFVIPFEYPKSSNLKNWLHRRSCWNALLDLLCCPQIRLIDWLILKFFFIFIMFIRKKKRKKLRLWKSRLTIGGISIFKRVFIISRINSTECFFRNRLLTKTVDIIDGWHKITTMILVL